MRCGTLYKEYTRVDYWSVRSGRSPNHNCQATKNIILISDVVTQFSRMPTSALEGGAQERMSAT